MSGIDLLVSKAVDAALAAGREILEVYAGEHAVELKEDRSPLTKADRRAHAAILKELSVTGIPVLSEEGRTIPLEERQGWQRYWLVDPLDGTKEFIKRNGEFTVNIALMECVGGAQGTGGMAVPIAGVLYVPVKDVLYMAWQGGGAYRLEAAATLPAGTAYERAARAQRLPLGPPPNAYTIVASRSHQSPETAAFIRTKEKEHGAVRLASMGSALKICLVAEGAAHVYPRFAPTMEWDTAAGQAIAMEAGRELIDMSTGAPMRYNKHELVNQWFIVQ